MTTQDKKALWKRVGEFVRARRDELGLSQTQVMRVLGYQSAASISCIENGLESLPAKRAYAWAEVLEVPRDAFFQFVTGLVETMEVAVTSRTESRVQVTQAEEDLIVRYRRLPPKFQRRLREHVGELEILARAERGKP